MKDISITTSINEDSVKINIARKIANKKYELIKSVIIDSNLDIKVFNVEPKKEDKNEE